MFCEASEKVNIRCRNSLGHTWACFEIVLDADCGFVCGLQACVIPHREPSCFESRPLVFLALFFVCLCYLQWLRSCVPSTSLSVFCSAWSARCHDLNFFVFLVMLWWIDSRLLQCFCVHVRVLRKLRDLEVCRASWQSRGQAKGHAKGKRGKGKNFLCFAPA